MRKKLVAIACAGLLLCGCSSNTKVTSFGGTKEIELPENMKFVNYNIQTADTIWCTYRPMRADEQPEVYIVQQNAAEYNFLGGGKFIVYETKDGVQAELPKEK